MDDIICWADIQKEMFAITCDILKMLGDAGVVMNGEKLQYCQEVVTFAGYRVSKAGYQLDPTIFNKVRDFPMPKTKKGVCAWFGLVNQTTNASF